MGEMIEFSGNGKTLSGYLASPPAGQTNGAGRKGVIVLQEWWGLVPHIKDVADRFAAEGFLALAPDLYRGESTTSPDEAGRKLMALNIAQVELDLRGAINALLERGATGKVGVVGFCMGGQLALLAATTNPDQVGAAVDYYGIHPKVKPDFTRLSCPVLAFFGGKDEFVDRQAAAQLVAAMEAAGADLEHKMYEDAGHAFFNDKRPDAYHREAAADSWERTLEFLSSRL